MASILKVDEIQSTSAGGITMPKQPRWDVIGNNNAYVATSPIPFPTVLVDNANAYSTSTYAYTVPIAGDYFVEVQLGILRIIGANSAAYPNIQQNGVNKGYSYFQLDEDGTHYINATLTRILTCAAGDTLRATFGQSTDGAYYNGANESRFHGYLVG
jgi:hypothetical protein